MRVRLLLIDGLNLIRRVQAGLPEVDGADPAATTDACLRSVRRAIGDTSPSHVACVFDGGGPTWRHQLLPTYKAGRKPMPEMLANELPNLRERIGGLGVACLSVPGTEADDVIATLASKLATHGGDAVILSTDRAFQALLGPHIAVRDHFARAYVEPADVVARFGVSHQRLLDLWALSGYPSSAIAGVPGIGPKTAIALLAQHGDLAGILAATPTIAGRVGEILRAHADTARLCRRLVAPRDDLEIGVNLSALRWEGTAG